MLNEKIYGFLLVCFMLYFTSTCVIYTFTDDIPLPFLMAAPLYFYVMTYFMGFP